MRNVHSIVVGLGILLTASVALAQEPPPPPPPAQPTPPPPQAQAGGQVEGTLPAPKVGGGPANIGPGKVKDNDKDDGITDHERVVGKFGVMYFGVNQVPLASGTPTNQFGATQTIATPTIGVRYWFQEKIGIDAGVGLGIQSSSTAVKANGQPEVDTDGPAVVAFLLHAGLPLAFAYGKHYKFLLVPEINFGYATQTVAFQNVNPAPGDVHLSGYRLDVGARVGTEIQFGFIGIPELALQASIGLDFRRQLWHASQDSSTAQPNESSASHGETSFGSTVQSDPWALFVNNISAIYYFP